MMQSTLGREGRGAAAHNGSAGEENGLEEDGSESDVGEEELGVHGVHAEETTTSTTDLAYP